MATSGTTGPASSKRVFLIVLDSMGIGAMPDAKIYGDSGSNTLHSISQSQYFSLPNLQALGFFNIEGVSLEPKSKAPNASFARMSEASNGKDTTIGHWEIAGVQSSKPLPTYKQGFPTEIIEKFKTETGHGVLCNLPYSGTEVIKKFGQQHEETGDLIIYTSADSVFQIAAHESIVPPKELYRYCRTARKILTGEHSVGRVIARPFTGTYPNYVRTSNRHDFSLPPPKTTMLDQIKETGLDVIAIGKINDIFSGRGITHSLPTANNKEGILATIDYISSPANFNGLCFVNLVDFDMLYGHRNDPDGYAKAMSEFDSYLPDITKAMQPNDILLITADHGCDPKAPSTDHSREYTPLIIYGQKINPGINLGTRSSFSDIGATILDYFKIPSEIRGTSFLEQVIKDA